MHQCLEDLKLLLTSEIPDSEFDRVLDWTKEIVREASFRRRKVETMLEAFMKDRGNIGLYSAIMATLRADIAHSKGINLVRHEQLKVIRNRMYQYTPSGYVAPTRSANFDY